jgi:hypothetical protein
LRNCHGGREVRKPGNGTPECSIGPADGAHLGAGDRMREAEQGGVEEEPRACRPAVDTVTDDRTSELCEMHTNLVLLARLERHEAPEDRSRARYAP